MKRRIVWFASVFAVAAVAGAQPPAPGGPPPGGPRGWAAGGNTLDFIAGDTPFGLPVQGAPYSGEGVTTVTQTLADGTRIERTVRAKFYRDSEGRMRREQTILGLGALGESTAVTIVDPVARVTYALNPATHEGRRSAMPRDTWFGPPPPPPPPPPPGGGMRRGGSPAGVPNTPEPLGTRQIEGIAATGTRRTEIIPAGRIGNDRPIEITDERWESLELKVLLLSRHHDPRTGDVEYRLTNVNRSDPPRELFTPPEDYTIRDAPPPPPPPPSRQ
jgi:hypothetical protein